MAAPDPAVIERQMYVDMHLNGVDDLSYSLADLRYMGGGGVNAHRAATAGAFGNGNSPRKDGRVFNALEYGVVAGGVVDNAAALNSVIVEANSLGGGVVLLPVGVVGTLSPIIVPSNVTLRGHGHSRTSIRYLAGPPISNLVWVTGDNVTVEDMSIEANTGIALHVTSSVGNTSTLYSNISISRVRISGATSSGIRVTNPVHDMYVTDCSFDGPVGLHVYAPPVPSGQITDNVIVSGNRFTGCVGVVCQFFGGNDPLSRRFKNITIFNNSLRDFGDPAAIPIEPTGIINLIASNNLIVGPATRGISMGNNRSVTCVGNVITDQSIYAFELNGGENYTISGNTVERCASFAQETGFFDLPGRLTDVLIVGNTYVGSGLSVTTTADVISLPTALRVRVIDNTFTDWQFLRGCIRLGEGYANIATDCVISNNHFTVNDSNTAILAIMVRKAVRTIIRDNRVSITRDMAAADNFSTVAIVGTDAANTETLIEGNEINFLGAIVVPNWVAGIGNGYTSASATPTKTRIIRNRVTGATWGMWLVNTDPDLEIRDNDVKYCTNSISGGRDLVNNDTGWRSITYANSGSPAGWLSAGYAFYIRRIGNVVYVRAAGTLSGSWTNADIAANCIAIPAGFKQQSYLQGPQWFSRNTTTSAMATWECSNANGLRIRFGAVANDVSDAVFATWTTSDAWPTTLPGTAL